MCGVQSDDGESHSSLMQQQRLVAEGSNVCPPLSSVPIFPSALVILVYLSPPQSLSCCFFSFFFPYSLDLFFCLQNYYGYNYYRLCRGKRSVCACGRALKHLHAHVKQLFIRSVQWRLLTFHIT